MRLFRPLKVFIILITIFQMTFTVAAAPTQPAMTPVTIQLTPLSIDDPELVNPGRGFYRWRGEEIVPASEPALDEYDRYFWYDPDNPENSLETSPGVYNFSMLDQAIADAAARGHKFAFRIRAMANKRSGKRFVPDYLARCGWDYRGAFIPDWNSACFQDNAKKLMDALGQRYNDDPRIAWMDIGLFGEWGEWALSEEIYTSAPKGITQASDASLARIIDIQVDAFPHVRKVMMAKTRSSAVIHALTRSNQVGWRVDCFGRQNYFNFPTHPDYLPAWEYMQDRWKTAPVIVEFCADNVSLSSALPVKQVQDFHISLIGNGNFDGWDRLNKQKQDNLILVGKTTGYRYQIQDITVPDVWAPGEEIHLITDWENVGVAPHYEKTEVFFRLYDPQQARIIWQAKSSIDLRTLLPTGDQPFSLQDTLALPAKLVPGVYQLRIIVIDPTGYRKPLRLAIANRRSDGSYLLGNVTVGAPVGMR